MVLNAYGNKCLRCGFNDIRALTIDHIGGKASKQRKEISPRQLLFKIIKENYPKEYQLLCANCNMIKMKENKEGNWGNTFGKKL
jgi:hypothetical protein